MADDLHDLSALYALDALDGEERGRFEAHLDDCERCRTELNGLRGAAGALAFAVAGPAPPAELRSRILDAARAEGQNVVPFRPRRSVAVSVAAAVAVAATAAAVALGLWAASLDHSLAVRTGRLADPRRSQRKAHPAHRGARRPRRRTVGCVGPRREPAAAAEREGL